jgi:hypothetical protein
MGHSRSEGHEIEIVTVPDDGMVLTNSITRGSTGELTFSVGSIVGSLQGDLLVTVLFEDGESVHERIPMSALLSTLIGEIVHSKQMRAEMPQEAP